MLVQLVMGCRSGKGLSICYGYRIGHDPSELRALFRSPPQGKFGFPDCVCYIHTRFTGEVVMDTVISVLMIALAVWGLTAPLVVILGIWYLRVCNPRKGEEDV
jgi:hypothetical protein